MVERLAVVSLQEGQGMHGVSHNEDKSQEVTCIVRQCTAATDYVQRRASGVEQPWALFLAMCRARVGLEATGVKDGRDGFHHLWY